MSLAVCYCFKGREGGGVDGRERVEGGKLGMGNQGKLGDAGG